MSSLESVSSLGAKAIVKSEGIVCGVGLRYTSLKLFIYECVAVRIMLNMTEVVVYFEELHI